MLNPSNIFDPCLNRTQISNPSVGNRESRGVATRLLNFMTTKQVIRQCLDGYVGTQLNIDAESAREILAEHISERLKYYSSQDEFWEGINEDI